MENLFYSFSYKQEKYHELTEGARRYLKWSGEVKTWPYHKCKVSLIGMEGEKIRIVLRREKTGYSSFMNSEFSVNLMMSFISIKTQEPTHNDDGNWEINFKIEQSNDKDHRDLSKVKIFSEDKNSIDILYDQITKNTGKPPLDPTIFSSDVEKLDEMIPVIYQPKIDAWKNFLREIHVNDKAENLFEVTLVFQDEQLRKHFVLDLFYRIFRLFRYKRIVDIENFYIYTAGKKSFTFPGIYSENNTLFDDSTHFDKPENGPIKEREIDYYFQDKNHPIVFVNTSNHALAPHDNNHDMWKLEYIPWSNKIPINLGKQPKEHVIKNQKWKLRKKVL